MRRIAIALHVLAVNSIGLEGFLVAGGLIGLTYVAWYLDWLLGVAVASLTALVIGIAVAAPGR